MASAFFVVPVELVAQGFDSGVEDDRLCGSHVGFHPANVFSLCGTSLKS